MIIIIASKSYLSVFRSVCPDILSDSPPDDKTSEWAFQKVNHSIWESLSVCLWTLIMWEMDKPNWAQPRTVLGWGQQILIIDGDQQPWLMIIGRQRGKEWGNVKPIWKPSNNFDHENQLLENEWFLFAVTLPRIAILNW